LKVIGFAADASSLTIQHIGCTESTTLGKTRDLLSGHNCGKGSEGDGEGLHFEQKLQLVWDPIDYWYDDFWMIEECWPDLGGRRRGCSTRLERDREGWRREKRREQRAEEKRSDDWARWEGSK
jgi:hypothetical protein